MALFKGERLNDYETNAVGMVEQIKALDPGERVNIETFWGFAFQGTAQEFLEQVQFIQEGDEQFKVLTADHQWRIQVVFHVDYYKGLLEVIQTEKIEQYEGKGKK